MKITRLFHSDSFDAFSKFKSLQGISKTALMRNVISALGGSMVAYLPIEEIEKHGVHILRVGGRLDATSAPLLERKLSSWVETPGAKVLVNFEKLQYLSSAGMRVMLAASKRLKATKGQMVFTSLQPQVMEIVKLAGFDVVLSFYSTENHALREMTQT